MINLLWMSCSTRLRLECCAHLRVSLNQALLDGGYGLSQPCLHTTGQRECNTAR